jgi:hypothetical protein
LTEPQNRPRQEFFEKPHQKAAWQYQEQGLVLKNLGSVVVEPGKRATDEEGFDSATVPIFVVSKILSIFVTPPHHDRFELQSELLLMGCLNLFDALNPRVNPICP